MIVRDARQSLSADDGVQNAIARQCSQIKQGGHHHSVVSADSDSDSACGQQSVDSGRSPEREGSPKAVPRLAHLSHPGLRAPCRPGFEGGNGELRALLGRAGSGTYRYAGGIAHSKLKKRMTRHESLRPNPYATGPNVPEENLHACDEHHGKCTSARMLEREKLLDAR